MSNTIYFYKSDDLSICLTFVGSVTNNPIDITDYEIYFSVAKTESASYSDAIMSISVGNGLDIEHTDPANGYTVIRIQDTETSITNGSYFYKLKIKNNLGFDKTLETGKFIVYNYNPNSEPTGASYTINISNGSIISYTINLANTICSADLLTSDNITTDTTNFSGNLSSEDDTVQKALETLDQLQASGSPTWGNITGTLSNQTDLQNVLNTKASTSHAHTGTYEPANANIQSHISDTSNPHGVDKNDVGLGEVQNINWCDYVSMSTNSITITDDHKGKTIWTTSASAVSAAVASDLGLDFVCGVIQGGAGQVTFSGLGDVTIENENDHTKTSKLRSAVSLRILPDGTCKLIGETA